MMKLLGSLVIIVASLGIIYGGLRYIRFSKNGAAKVVSTITMIVAE